MARKCEVSTLEIGRFFADMVFDVESVRLQVASQVAPCECENWVQQVLWCLAELGEIRHMEWKEKCESGMILLMEEILHHLGWLNH